MAKIGLKTIAEKTGFSISTVSRALKGHTSISDETRKRIHTAYEQLRCHKNSNNTANTKRSVLGIFVPADKIVNKYEDDLQYQIQSVQEIAMRNGFALMMGIYGDNGVGDQMIANKSIDGIILARTHINDPIYERLQQQNLPFIALHRILKDTNYNYIGVDDFQGTFRAVEHLISRGYKEIAFVSGPSNVNPIVEKLNGYKAALNKYKLPINPNWILQGKKQTSEADGIRMGKHLIESSHKPRAVFAATDYIALGILQAAQQKGLDVPRDLAIIGYDNIPRAAICSPPLTTVSVPWIQMINLAIQSLIQLIEFGPCIDNIQIKLNTKIEIRLTT